MKVLSKLSAVIGVASALILAVPLPTLAQEQPTTPVCEHCEGPTWYVVCEGVNNGPQLCTAYIKRDGQWEVQYVWWKNIWYP